MLYLSYTCHIIVLQVPARTEYKRGDTVQMENMLHQAKEIRKTCSTDDVNSLLVSGWKLAFIGQYADETEDKHTEYTLIRI